MFRATIRQAIYRLRRWGRQVLLLPTMETQGFGDWRACLHTAAAFVTRNQISGDFLDFGVWHGNSFMEGYRALSRAREEHLRWMDSHLTHASLYGQSTPDYQRWKEWRPRFFAFESFAGFPKVPGESNEDWCEGAFSCTEEEFRENVVKGGVDLADVVVVPGFYDKTLNQETKKRYGLHRAAVAVIGCCSYESAVPVLEFLTDLVGPGTVLIFDEWFRYGANPNQGEQRACREWLQRNPHLELSEYWREAPQTMSFIVNLR